MRLALIRHGRTAWNLRMAYIGRTDLPLCPEGREELERCRRSAGYPAVQRLFSSPMLRCVQTCEILYPGFGPVLLESMRERDFGRFEGLTHPEIAALPGCGDWGMDEERMECPGGERWEDFARRVLEGLERLEKEAGARDAALVCHGGVIMALLEKAAGGGRYGYMCPPGGGYLLAGSGGCYSVLGSIGP